jgi:hypothetical protein
MSWEDPLETVFENALKIKIPNMIFNGRSVSGFPLRITNTRKKTTVKKIGSRSVQAYPRK